MGAHLRPSQSYQDIDPSQVSAFFSRLVPQAMSDSFLMLTADNDFIKTWVEQHYTEVIVRALRDLTGVVFAVAIAVDPTQEQRKSAAGGATIPSGSPFGTLTTDAGTSTCAASGNDDGASPLSAHRGICSPTAGLWCSPGLRRPPSNHPAWSLIPS